MTSSHPSHCTVGTACGKVILLGEHAVVYGVPAIAVGIDRGVRASARPSPSPTSTLSVRGWEIQVTDDQTDRDLGRAFRAVLDATRASAPIAPVDVEAECELPPGGGLGCSAALGVAIARAIDPRATHAEILARAMAWERVFHGNPSGIDAVVAANGGCVFFTKGVGHEPVRVRGGLVVCVGHSGIASSTKSMVEAVARLRERRPEVVEKAFEAIRSLVANARLAIEAGDRYALGKLMDLNQMLLSGLFVSSEEIERMCGLARSAGALGAKLTGAGGGGSVVALASSAAAAERILEAWRADGFDGFSAKVAPPHDEPRLYTETAP